MASEQLKILVGVLVLIVALISGVIVIRSCGERLPGYDMAPVDLQVYKEADGSISEFFTGAVEKVEDSILGPKVTVKKDKKEESRTFFVKINSKVYLGLEKSGGQIKGQEEVLSTDIARGQRVACFIGKGNEARHIHILQR